jgi:hypothetical protein
MFTPPFTPVFTPNFAPPFTLVFTPTFTRPVQEPEPGKFTLAFQSLDQAVAWAAQVR